MKIQMRIIHLGIACAYILAILGVREDIVSMVLACGYLLIAATDLPAKNVVDSKK
jgi:hypothetical protein